MGVTIGFVKNTAQIIVFAFLTLCDLPEIHRAGPLSGADCAAWSMRSRSKKTQFIRLDLFAFLLLEIV